MNQMDFDIELKLSRQQLNYLYALLKDLTPQPLEDEVKLYKSTFDVVKHEMIANEIFDLLNELEKLADHSDDNLYDEWCDKLWVEEHDVHDNYGVLIARNRKLWNWETVAEMRALVEKLKAEINK